ncbi:hypothetical protein DFH09DRAFT_934176, partial [Mycena vulgaris]
YWLAGPESGNTVHRPNSRPSDPALVCVPLVPQLVDVGRRVLLHDFYGGGYSDAPAVATYDASLVATFPDLVDNEVVLVASAGLIEFSDLSRTAKLMSSTIVQALSTYPLIHARHPPDHRQTTEDVPVHKLVRLQSAHLPGLNRAVSSSLRAGPVTGLRWAFESRGMGGRRVLVIHGTTDQTVPPTHLSQLKTLLANSTGVRTSFPFPFAFIFIACDVTRQNVSFFTTMTFTATFRSVPLSTDFGPDREKSLLCLDWVLNSGTHTVRSVALGILTLPHVGGVIHIDMDLPIVSSLPTDLLLGRDWLRYCRESLPETTFYLSSGPLDFRRAPTRKFLFLLFLFKI